MPYATITVLPVLMLIGYAVGQPVSIRRGVVLALAFGLVAYGNQWSFFNGTRNIGLPELALSYKGYGLALMWGLVMLTLWPVSSRQGVSWPTIGRTRSISPSQA